MIFFVLLSNGEEDMLFLGFSCGGKPRRHCYPGTPARAAPRNVNLLLPVHMVAIFKTYSATDVFIFALAFRSTALTHDLFGFCNN
jgi:hypothetical protein